MLNARPAYMNETRRSTASSPLSSLRRDKNGRCICGREGGLTGDLLKFEMRCGPGPTHARTVAGQYPFCWCGGRQHCSYTFLFSLKDGINSLRIDRLTKHPRKRSLGGKALRVFALPHDRGRPDSHQRTQQLTEVELSKSSIGELNFRIFWLAQSR